MPLSCHLSLTCSLCLFVVVKNCRDVVAFLAHEEVGHLGHCGLAKMGQENKEAMETLLEILEGSAGEMEA